MTTGLSKYYSNKIASFSYIHCPFDYFSVGVTTENQDDINYLIATPEKALCDLMIYTPHLNLRFQKEIKAYLESDIRFDMTALSQFNLELLREILEKGKKKNMIGQLLKFIENERTL